MGTTTTNEGLLNDFWSELEQEDEIEEEEDDEAKQLNENKINNEENILDVLGGVTGK